MAGKSRHMGLDHGIHVEQVFDVGFQGNGVNKGDEEH